eukprot:142250-Rhodomonas_salina.1
MDWEVPEQNQSGFPHNPRRGGLCGAGAPVRRTARTKVQGLDSEPLAPATRLPRVASQRVESFRQTRLE